MGQPKPGDAGAFEKNWRQRQEAYYTHWTPAEPINQVQLAFRNHWSLFNQLMARANFNQGKRVLEVGCGRGSLSCYFSNAGYHCTLLDVSRSVINIAKKIFELNNLKGTFAVGDANCLPFEAKSFDMVFSIGLLEHFENIQLPIQEQLRVLDDGGLLIAYVVPQYSDNVQKDFEWINDILRGYAQQRDIKQVEKQDVFRSDATSQQYIPILKRCGLKGIESSGVYPLPMISHSIKFPFTLMPEQSEKALVKYLMDMLDQNAKRAGKHPWLCREGYGQAFVVWGYK